MAAVAVAVSPIALGAVSLVGDTWLPLSDWASQVFRTSQVGTAGTPLVGPYSVRTFAHPGPLIYWLAAPLHRLTGGDPRSLLWTAALVNCACVAAIAAVAWRRGRWPLLLGSLLFVTLLVHGLGPERTVDMWNPYVPLLPFLLTVLLVWDAALGRRRALVEAVVPASFAMQSHLSFVSLTLLLVVWLVAWSRWWPGADPDPDADADHPWARLRRPIGTLLAVLWFAPLCDALFDLHNPYRVVGSFVPDGEDRRVGAVEAVSVVGRYVRPDGPWIGGAEPTLLGSVRGSGPLPGLLAVAALAACAAIAWRRRWADVAALATITLVLVAGALPSTSQIYLPSGDYLTQWLKVVGGLVWFTVAWTGWRLVETRWGAAPAPRRRRSAAAAGLAAVALVTGAAWTWGDAESWQPPGTDDAALVRQARAAFGQRLPKDRTYRVEPRGDDRNHYRGLVYWMIEDGYDVTTSDGRHGLKWGHPHRHIAGDDYDTYLTLAVHYGGSWTDTYAACLADPEAELVFGHDDLTPDERAWLDDVRLRTLVKPGSVTDSDRRRSEVLEARGFRLGVFSGPDACADE